MEVQVEVEVKVRVRGKVDDGVRESTDDVNDIRVGELVSVSV
jgi:hypothetical protein